MPIPSNALFARSETENCSLPSGVPERLIVKVYILPFLVNADGAVEDSDAVPPTIENSKSDVSSCPDPLF